MTLYIVKVHVLVSPFKVVNDSFVSQLFFHYKDVLEEIKDSLLYVKMVKFRNHCFLVFQIGLILIYQSISLVNYASNVVKN